MNVVTNAIALLEKDGKDIQLAHAFAIELCHALKDNIGTRKIVDVRDILLVDVIFVLMVGLDPGLIREDLMISGINLMIEEAEVEAEMILMTHSSLVKMMDLLMYLEEDVELSDHLSQLNIH